MPDYSRSKIYMIQCSTDHYYIGSTTCSNLSQRLTGHRRDAAKPGNSRNRLYRHINNIGWDNAGIILLEAFNCSNDDELKKKENEYITASLDDELCLNHRVSYRAPEDRPEVPLVKCQCGGSYPANNTKRHMDTRKHHLALAALEASAGVTPEANLDV